MVNNRYYLHMKKLKYLAALLCLTTLGLFTSCSKEYSDLIVGSWKLVSLTINGEVITDNVPAATWTFDAEGNVTISAYGGSESGRYNIIDKETAGKVISVLEQDSTEMSMKWNKRYRDNVEKMKSGNIFEIADIVRNLSFKQKEKSLSTTEKKMLLNAKQILVSELVLAQDSTTENIEELVNNKINESYEVHEVTDGEVKNVVGLDDATNNIVKKFIPLN